MIFLTVGTQVPFDRLVAAVDDWAQARGRADIVAQIGPSHYRPRNFPAVDFMEPCRFADVQRECRVMVAHAGLGSIVYALQTGKPIIIMPRDHRRGEHRNAHQLATVEQFADRAGVYIAADEPALHALLDRADELVAGPLIEATAPVSFTSQLGAWLRGGPNG